MAGESLRILHAMRAPVGGLFRHVADLAREQAARGHAVGIVADSGTGSVAAERRFDELTPLLALGLTRLPMSRHVGLGDVSATRAIGALARRLRIDVLHGHGAKGGAYGRLARAGAALRIYTPHGGSLHYSPTSLPGLFYLSLERFLAARTDAFLFESAYGRDAFAAKVGNPAAPTFVIHNGVAPEEFEVVTPLAAAADILFVGELRHLKGVDVLIEAIARMVPRRPKLSAVIVGTGPDGVRFAQLARERGLEERIAFAGAMPARKAFLRGRVLAVPSRAESLPYIVLEAAAAGVPMVATNVGGIPEIFGSDTRRLVPPDDPAALAAAIEDVLDRGGRTAAAQLRARVQLHFSQAGMTDAVLDAYRRVKARRRA